MWPLVRSGQLNWSVVSDSVTPWAAAHQASLPSQTPWIHSNSCPSSRGCHPTTISSSVIPFSSHLQSFLASGSFPISQLLSGGQSIGNSASASVLEINIQDWFPLGWNGWISLRSKGLSRVFNTTVQKHQFFAAQIFFMVQLSSSVHDYLLEKS